MKLAILGLMIALAVIAQGYVVSFDARNGDIVEPIVAEAGDPIEPPVSPKKSGFTFLGWFEPDAQEPFSFDVMPERDVELSGLWQWTRKPSAAYSEEKLLALDIPLLVIETDDGEEPDFEKVVAPPGCDGVGITNANKAPGRLVMKLGNETLYDSGDYKKKESGITIKIRGNTSAANSSKKPYKIKLQKKADLLMLGDGVNRKDKDWILLASTATLNTEFGLLVNELVGLQWTPRYRHVNVLMNGDYRGLYLLCEAEGVNENCRINVDEETGALFEVDAYWWNEDVYFKTKGIKASRGYTFKYPDSEDIVLEQLLSVSNAMERVEASILASDGNYPEQIDVSSFAKWLLGHDILGTWDAGGSNIYLMRRDDATDAKVEMANMWDFDTIMRMSNAWSRAHSTGTSLRFDRLLNKVADDAFRDAYRCEWLRIRGRIAEAVETAFSEFDDSGAAAALDEARELDGKRWAKRHSVAVDAENIRGWVADRVAWIDRHIAEAASSNIFLAIDPNGGKYQGSEDVLVKSTPLKTGGTAHSTIGRSFRSGCEFLGYFTKPVGGECVYDAQGKAVKCSFWSASKSKGGKFRGKSDLTVYAQWAATDIYLTIDPNGGKYQGGREPLVKSTPLKTGGTAHSTIGRSFRSGCEFLGYFTKPVGGECVYDAQGKAVKCSFWSASKANGGRFLGLADLTVYAQWAAL